MKVFSIRLSNLIIMIEIVRKLLSKGVCADVANSDGLTALHQVKIDLNSI